jgi:hypothetical protein
MTKRTADFLVSFNPDVESDEVLGTRIIQSLFYGRLKQNKPCRVFVGGDSGEGKSLGAIKIAESLLASDGLDLVNYMNDVNIYTPIDYPTKMKNILFNKDLKNVRILIMHEAREIIKAKLWQSFISQAVADVNAQARHIKRLVTVIVSQFIRDITLDVRYTLNFYCTVERPRNSNARMRIYILWKDDSDIEKPKLRKRRIFGYIRTPNKTYKFSPKYLILGLPSKELRNLFDKADYEAKEKIIKHKLEKVVKLIEADIGIGSSKIDSIVEHYSSNPENLNLIGKTKRGKFVLNPSFISMHDLTAEEGRLFSARLFEKIIDKKIDRDISDLESDDDGEL